MDEQEAKAKENEVVLAELAAEKEKLEAEAVHNATLLRKKEAEAQEKEMHLDEMHQRQSKAAADEFAGEKARLEAELAARAEFNAHALEEASHEHQARLEQEEKLHLVEAKLDKVRKSKADLKAKAREEEQRRADDEKEWDQAMKEAEEEKARKLAEEEAAKRAKEAEDRRLAEEAARRAHDAYNADALQAELDGLSAAEREEAEKKIILEKYKLHPYLGMKKHLIFLDVPKEEVDECLGKFELKKLADHYHIEFPENAKKLKRTR